MKRYICYILLVSNTILLSAEDFTRDLKLTQPRMNGNDVVAIQNELLSFGFSDIGTADGWYGPKTEMAVKQYQDYLGFVKDGVVTKVLWQNIFSNEPVIKQIHAYLHILNILERDTSKHFQTSSKIYNYLSGPNYSKSELSLTKNDSDAVFLCQYIVAVKNAPYGYYIYIETYTPSGDWFVVQEDYYNSEGSLLFIRWNMNTFQASKASSDDFELAPTTVRKVLYFDVHGKKLIEKIKTFELNTEKEQAVDFADREVEVRPSIKNLEFRHLLNW